MQQGELVVGHQLPTVSLKMSFWDIWTTHVCIMYAKLGEKHAAVVQLSRSVLYVTYMLKSQQSEVQLPASGLCTWSH